MEFDGANACCITLETTHKQPKLNLLNKMLLQRRKDRAVKKRIKIKLKIQRDLRNWAKNSP